jgi:hypothetical protein
MPENLPTEASIKVVERKKNKSIDSKKMIVKISCVQLNPNVALLAAAHIAKN